jgi:hypothetical protein
LYLINTNTCRNQIEKILNRHRDRKSDRIRSCADPCEATNPSRIVCYTNRTGSIASRFVFRTRIMYSCRLKHNTRISSRPDIRRRTRPTLIAIVSDGTDRRFSVTDLTKYSTADVVRYTNRTGRRYRTTLANSYCPVRKTRSAVTARIHGRFSTTRIDSKPSYISS